MIKVGDRFKLHSENGMVYKIVIVNINEFRELSMKYGANVYDENGNSLDNVMFFDDEFLEKCEKIMGDKLC